MTDDVTNKTMVAGFFFCGDRVLLVEKKHPGWMKGLWNGIGGVVEPGEQPYDAMVREFIEETGMHVGGWQCFCTEVEPFGASVHFYWAKGDDWPPHLMRTTNDSGEKLAWHSVGHLLCELESCVSVVGNLNWLLPMARDPRGLVSVIYSRGDIRERPTW